MKKNFVDKFYFYFPLNTNPYICIRFLNICIIFYFCFISEFYLHRKKHFDNIRVEDCALFYYCGKVISGGEAGSKWIVFVKIMTRSVEKYRFLNVNTSNLIRFHARVK